MGGWIRWTWRMVALTGVGAVGILIGSGACSSHTATRPSVDMAGARVMPGHAPIVIDGQSETSQEWAGAARVQLKPDIKADFLWDDKGVYGRLDSSQWYPEVTEDGAICVNLSSLGTGRSLRLYVRGTIRGGQVFIADVAREVRATTQPTTAPLPVDRSSVSFASTAAIAARGFPWTAEFFVPWDLITADGKPASKMRIFVYRIFAERPYSVLDINSPDE